MHLKTAHSSITSSPLLSQIKFYIDFKPKCYFPIYQIIISCHFCNHSQSSTMFWFYNPKLINCYQYSAPVNSSSAHPPLPHRENAGHLLRLSVPLVRHSQCYLGSGAGDLNSPGWPPGILTRGVFSLIKKKNCSGVGRRRSRGRGICPLPSSPSRGL